MKENKKNRTQITQIGRISADFLWLAPFLLALSTVFVISSDLANGVVSGKYFWFYGSMGLIGLVTLVRTLINRHSFRFSAQDVLVLLFAAAIYLPAFLFNTATPNTTKLTLFTLLPVLYFSFRLIINTFKRKDMVQHVFCLFIVLTGLIEAVWGLRQLYGFESSQHSLFKLTGSFFNPGPYAGYLAVAFPIAFHYWIQGKRYTLLRIFTAIACIVMLLVLPAAMSRASWLAVVSGSVVVLYFRYSGQIRQFYRQHKKQVWITGCATVLFLTAASAGMYYLKKDSADGRALTWKIALQTIAKHPFGAGLGNFPGAYGETQATYFASGQATETEQLVAGTPEYGFNEYLQIAVESGIIALLLFVGIIVLAIRDKIRTNNWGTLGSLVALLIFAGFSYPFSVLPFLIVFVFLLSINQPCHPASSGNRSVRGWRVKLAIAGSILLLLVTSVCLWKQYPVYQAYRQWKANQIYYHAGLFKDTAESYARLYPYLNDQVRFLFEYAQCLSKSDQPEKSNEVLQRAIQISCDPMLYNIMGKNYQAMKQYEQAETVLIKATQLIPSRLYPWYLLTKLYDEMGWEEKAEETAKIVLTKEPKVQSPAVREMREEVKELRVKN
ncbi:MAG: O-antigen ligase family protein [Dysgonamonadaceae bacterium]|jgi:O-antigen ligase|nr:O-antigen ligase family protein [Dysgonamonadaceae bacterium]